MTATTSDLDLLLDLGGTIDDDRATLLLTLATNLALSYVSPLPDAADGVILGAAGRAYLNPGGIESVTTGPESVAYGSSMIGVYLTAADIATLKRMGGAGGAFSIQTMSDTAGCGLPIWDENIWNPDGGLIGEGLWSESFAP